MATIKIREREINVTENWEQVDLEQCIKIIKLFDEMGQGELIEEQFLVNFIECITDLTSDEMMNFYSEELVIFTEYIDNFKDVSKLQRQECKSFNLNDIVYAVVIPSKLTLGEEISIKLLQKSSADRYDTWLNLLTILVRPGIEKKNEFGETFYEVEPLKADIELLNKRKQLLKKIPAVNALWIVEAFSAGRE
jgi:hypothetical protein